jgi:hypothetical protein
MQKVDLRPKIYTTMNKIKLLIGGLCMLSLVIGATVFAQGTATTTQIPSPVAEMPSPFREYRGDVSAVDLASAVITVTVYNDCKTTSGTTCATWYSMEKTLTFGQSLIMGPKDQSLRLVGEVKVGDKVRLYVRNSDGVTYAMKIVASGSIPEKPMMCGGIAGAKCAPGYMCKMEGNYPDAAGVCAPDDKDPKSKPPQICLDRVEDGKSVQVCKTLPPGVLKQGVKSEQVKHLQERLIKEGFLTEDSATGYFGGMTLNAVKQFQKIKGLPSTGHVGDMTLQELAK